MDPSLPGFNNEYTHIHHPQPQTHHNQQMNGNLGQNLEEYLFSNLEQITSSSSPEYDSFSSPITDAFINQDDLHFDSSSGIFDVLILHKPRGSKGIWQRVDNGDKLRVTKGKGKRLKLQFALPPGARCENLMNGNNLQIQLLESEASPTHSSQADSQDPDFSFECVKSFESLIEVELKLFKMGRKLQFFLQIRTTTADILLGKSVEFSTHNSGAVSTTAQQKDKISEPAKEHKPILSHIAQQQQVQQQHHQQSTVYPTLNNPTNVVTAPQIGSFDLSFMNGDKKRRLDPFEAQAQQQQQQQFHPLQQRPVQFLGPTTPASSTVSPINVVPGSLDVHGTVRAKAFMQFSDIRLKTNIQDIVDAIQIVTSLEGKSYEWREGLSETGAGGGKRVIGLIAQEVQKVVPEVVHQDPQTGFLAVSYAEILPILIEAFKAFLKDHQETKEDVRRELEELRVKLDVVADEMENNRKPQPLVMKDIRRISSYITTKPLPAVPPPPSKLANKDERNTFVDIVQKRKKQIIIGGFFVMSLIFLLIGITLTVLYRPGGDKNPVLPNPVAIKIEPLEFDPSEYFEMDYSTTGNGAAAHKRKQPPGKTKTTTTDSTTTTTNGSNSGSSVESWDVGFGFGIFFIVIGLMGMIGSGIAMCLFLAKKI